MAVSEQRAFVCYAPQENYPEAPKAELTAKYDKKKGLIRFSCPWMTVGEKCTVSRVSVPCRLVQTLRSEGVVKKVQLELQATVMRKANNYIPS